MSFLYFHRITSDEPREWSVSPDHSGGLTHKQFQQLLVSFRDRLRDWDECLGENGADERSQENIGLSFDDGYTDFVNVVLPHLEDAGVRVIIFITTGFANGHLVPYEYIVGELIRLKNPLKITSRRVQDCASLQSNWDIYRCLLSTMKKLAPHERHDLLAELLHDNDMQERDLNLPGMLQWEQVRMLSSHPLVDIGAHTKNHPHLPSLGAAQAWREIRKSKATIENEIGTEVEAFAYPYGAHTLRERLMLKAAGYRYGFATENGRNGAMAIPRLNAVDWTSLEQKDCEN